MLKRCALVLLAVFALVLPSSKAKAVTLNFALTFTPSGGPASGGTGLLVLNLPAIPDSSTSINTNGFGANFVSLAVTVNGISFSFPNASVYYLGMSNGVWNNISANSSPTSVGANSFSIGLGGLTYNLQQINVAQIGFGNFTIGQAAAGWRDSSPRYTAAVPVGRRCHRIPVAAKPKKSRLAAC